MQYVTLSHGTNEPLSAQLCSMAKTCHVWSYSLRGYLAMSSAKLRAETLNDLTANVQA